MAFCHSAPPVYALPDGSNPKHVAVLTRGDWNRLHYQLNKKAIDKQRNEAEKAEKLAMREKSKAMISTWTNTLQVSITICNISVFIIIIFTATNVEFRGRYWQ